MIDNAALPTAGAQPVAAADFDVNQADADIKWARAHHPTPPHTAASISCTQRLLVALRVLVRKEHPFTGGQDDYQAYYRQAERALSSATRDRSGLDGRQALQECRRVAEVTALFLALQRARHGAYGRFDVFQVRSDIQWLKGCIGIPERSDTDRRVRALLPVLDALVAQEQPVTWLRKEPAGRYEAVHRLKKAQRSYADFTDSQALEFGRDVARAVGMFLGLYVEHAGLHQRSVL